MFTDSKRRRNPIDRCIALSACMIMLLAEGLGAQTDGFRNEIRNPGSNAGNSAAKPDSAGTGSALWRNFSPQTDSVMMFRMSPVRTARPALLGQTWFRVGLVALGTGLAGYLMRKEADRSYDRYLNADSPAAMNRHFDRALRYDRISSGLYMICELNVCFSMWLGIRNEQTR
ncbi:hypothetical protein JW948_14535 [bacterium]|nr:hypothetical protein [bacterium]